jgi:hypothetical protein
MAQDVRYWHLADNDLGRFDVSYRRKADMDFAAGHVR